MQFDGREYRITGHYFTRSEVEIGLIVGPTLYNGFMIVLASQLMDDGRYKNTCGRAQVEDMWHETE